MNGADVVVIGGGIAGLSAAAALSDERRVAVIEAADVLGYHSSGRSVTFSHFGIGNATVRALTVASRRFFMNPCEGFSDVALSRTAPAMFVATEQMQPALAALHDDMAPYAAGLKWLNLDQIRSAFPPLRIGHGGIVSALLDPNGLRLDADALMQGYGRRIRRNGGSVHLGQRIERIWKRSKDWLVEAATGNTWSAPILINAAGAWADAVAALAGVTRIGVAPKRRTAIVIDGPDGLDVRGLPFVKTAVDDFYILPEAGKLIASPVDEIPSTPCDAYPEEWDIAVAAAKVEAYTSIKVKRIVRSWAGLRTFVADRTPTAGFAADDLRFFWLAGQGGFGLQTAPAMAEIVKSLVMNTEFPKELSALGVTQELVAPVRLVGLSKLRGGR